MSRLGLKSQVYHGEVCLGELDVIPAKDRNFQFPNNEIRIHRISPASERCPPLSILQTIGSFSVCCKLESSSPLEHPHLINLHASCHYELKTAVVLVGDEEIHLVAMLSKQKKYPCFWCYSVPKGLYNSSLGMLDMRCLSIVFDLDETLIVANTMKSFEDRIEALRGWIAREIDPLRLAGMHAEMKRYVEDRLILKQYLENDTVVENGKVFKVQMEEVPPLSDNHERFFRPIIRLQEKNIVLTRINPEIRDTSVLVRLRPAWEDLRSYLTAKGRKRFEVYVCTMAERDYALEMWRLLDPEAHLISLKQLQTRVVCVKSGSRKSLINVFQDGICHSKMAMVIDDRLKVWEDKDQPRVHVVPAFSPYYAPQAETANAVPVLCVARNVACNVRGCFYKEFDENLLRRITEVFYEDDVVNLPPAPDVSNYLISEDAGFVPNGIPPPFHEGMNGMEVERRLNRPDERHVIEPATQSTNNDDLRPETSQASIPILPNAVNPTSLGPLLPSQKPGLLGLPVRRDGFSDHHDMKRGNIKSVVDSRNQISGDPPILSRLRAQFSGPPIHGQGGWLVEDDINRGHPKNQPLVPVHESEVFKPEKQRAHHVTSFMTPVSTPSGLHLPVSEVKVEEAHNGPNSQKPNLPHSGQLTGPPIHGQGGWLVEDDINKGHPKNRPLVPVHESEVFKPEKQRAHHVTSFMTPVSIPSGLHLPVSEVKVEEAPNSQKPNLPLSGQLTDASVSLNQASSNSKYFPTEGVKINLLPSPLSISVLQEIARRCSSKVEFKSVLSTSKDLQFSVEVLFTDEKIGVGMGKTRKDAQQHAAENALHNLAEKYVAYMAPRSGPMDRDLDKLSLRNENGFLWEVVQPGPTERPKEEELPSESISEVAEAETVSGSSMAGNHQAQKRANSQRFQQSVPTKQAKEDHQQVSKNLPSSWQPKNGHNHVS